MVACAIYGAVTNDLKPLTGWALGTLCVLAGLAVQLEGGGALQAAIVQGDRSRRLRAWLAVAHFLRWALLAVPLLVAAANANEFSLGAAAGCVSVSPAATLGLGAWALHRQRRTN